jgi:hypothetical protein
MKPSVRLGNPSLMMRLKDRLANIGLGKLGDTVQSLAKALRYAKGRASAGQALRLVGDNLSGFSEIFSRRNFRLEVSRSA